jgi:hypothetical protein
MLQQHAKDGGNRNNAWKWEWSSKKNQEKYFIMLKILQNKPRQRKLTRISCNKFFK